MALFSFSGHGYAAPSSLLFFLSFENRRLEVVLSSCLLFYLLDSEGWSLVAYAHTRKGRQKTACVWFGGVTSFQGYQRPFFLSFPSSSSCFFIFTHFSDCLTRILSSLCSRFSAWEEREQRFPRCEDLAGPGNSNATGWTSRVKTRDYDRDVEYPTIFSIATT